MEPYLLITDQRSEQENLFLKLRCELQQRRIHNTIYFISTNGLLASQQLAKFGLFPPKDSIK